MKSWARTTVHSIRRWRLGRWEIAGNERRSGKPVTLTYFGHDFGFGTLASTLFAPGYPAQQSGHGLLGIPGLPLTPNAGNSDIVAIELEQAQWHTRDNGAGFYLPLWTGTEITVADAERRSKQSSSLKDDFRRVRKHGIVCELSDRDSDLRLFYQNMYVPYIRARHRELSLLDSWEVIERTARQGGLLLAKDSEGNPIGGNVFSQSPNRLHARALGLISNDRALLRTGVMSALYRACIEQARARGIDTVGLGKTIPFLNDGLIQFKKKWGLRLLGAQGQGIWLQFNRMTPAVESWLVNNPFLNLSQDQLEGTAFVADGGALDESDLCALHTRYHLSGMQSLRICSRDRNANRAQIPESLAADLAWGTRRRIYQAQDAQARSRSFAGS